MKLDTEKDDTLRFGSGQQDFYCDRCRRNFRIHHDAVFDLDGMRYHLCTRCLGPARHDLEFFKMLIQAYLRGVPIEECQS